MLTIAVIVVWAVLLGLSPGLALIAVAVSVLAYDSLLTRRNHRPA